MSKIEYNKYLEDMLGIINKHQFAFAISKSELGKTPIGKHKIRMNPGAVLVWLRAYRLSPKEIEFMEKELEVLLSLGCIVRCEATWVMPVIMVKKKDTTELRMCIDFT